MEITLSDTYPHRYNGISSNIFYILPHPYINYAINILGNVFNIDRNEFISVSLDGVGYHNIRVWANNKSQLKRIHRLIATIFVTNTTSYLLEDLVVNHKDGVKTNNNPNNLEWVTKQHDCMHAYGSGLRDDNIHLILHNMYTTITHYCNSYGEASRLTGLTAPAIHSYLNTMNTDMPYKGWLIQFANNNRTHRNWNK